MQQSYRWEKQVTKGGDRLYKLNAIPKGTIAKFIEARDRKTIVHDADLKRWALQENIKINLEGFQAASHWLSNFKYSNFKYKE